MIPEEVERILEENYKNFKELFKKGELRKAGELLWGTIVVLIKYLAFRDEKLYLNRHEEIRKYFIRRFGDNVTFLSRFSSAQSLHRNFYTNELENWEIQLKIEDTLKLIEELRKEARI